LSSDGNRSHDDSANHNEDWGIGSLNDGRWQSTGGNGFRNSGGRSRHATITIRVTGDGDYKFRFDPPSGAGPLPMPLT